MINLVYLDDSSSMRGPRMAKAHEIYTTLLNQLSLNDGQVTLFATKGSERKKLGTPPAHIPGRHPITDWADVITDWNGNGTTYLWDLVCNDTSSLPPDGVNIVIITDGEDNESDPPFYGFSGIIPTVRTLLRRGFTGEIHIVGFLSDDEAERYGQVSASTGGMFFNFGFDADRGIDEWEDEFLDPYVRESNDPIAKQSGRASRIAGVTDSRMPRMRIFNPNITGGNHSFETHWHRTNRVGSYYELRIDCSEKSEAGYRYISVHLVGEWRRSGFRDELNEKLSYFILEEAKEATKHGEKVALLFENKSTANTIIGKRRPKPTAIHFLVNSIDCVEVYVR